MASGIALYNFGPSWTAIAARHLSPRSRPRVVLALVIGLCLAARARHLLRHDHARGGERVRHPRLAAVSTFTGGEDGRTFRLPEVLRPAFHLVDRRSGHRSPAACWPITSCSSSRRWCCFLLLLRVVNSPFGRVLQAIRDNDFRAEALGYRTVVYSHDRQLPRRGGGGARRRALRAVAALHRAAIHALLRRSCSTFC